MFAGFSFRSYVIIAVVVAIGLYAAGWFVGEPVIQFFEQMKSGALSAGMAQWLADAIIEPIKFAFSARQGVVGPIIGGILWPLAAVWFLLLILLLAFSFIVPGLNQAADPITVG